MPSDTPIKNWVRAYKKIGVKELNEERLKKYSPVQFKLDTIQFMLRTGASHQETAMQFILNNPSLILRWMKAFSEQGIEGLKPKPKGRPSMSKKPINKRKRRK